MIEHQPMPKMDNKDRRIAFRKIQRAAIAVHRRSVGPRLTIALFFTVVTLCFGIVSGWLAPVGRMLFGLNLFVAAYFIPAIIAFFLTMRYSTQPKTWEEVLDRLLAEYDPASKSDFADLQAMIKEKGWDFEALRGWLYIENIARQLLENPEKNPAEHSQSGQFINRQL
jgi:hypothetical protein